MYIFQFNCKPVTLKISGSALLNGSIANIFEAEVAETVGDIVKAYYARTLTIKVLYTIITQWEEIPKHIQSCNFGFTIKGMAYKPEALETTLQTLSLSDLADYNIEKSIITIRRSLLIQDVAPDEQEYFWGKVYKALRPDI